MISNRRIIGAYLAVLVALIYGVMTGENIIKTTSLLNINITFSPAGYSIKCWECRSDGDPKCADPFDNTSFPITDCLTKAEKVHLPGLKATMCRKIRQKGLQQPNNFSSRLFIEHFTQ